MPQQQNSSSPFLISDSERGSYDYAGMTPDEAQAQRSIAQRRQMAKLMMSQGMQQAGKRGGMVGNIYVKSSPMEGLSGMAQVGLGGLADYLLAKESANTTAEHKKLTEAAIKKYIEQTSDVPEVPGTPASAGSAAIHTDSNLPDIIDASQQKTAITPSMRGNASTDNNGRIVAALFDGMKNKYVPNMRSNVLEPHPRFSMDELNALSQEKEDDNSYMARIGEMANEKDVPRFNAMPYQPAVDTPAVPPSLGTPGTPGVKRTREDIRRAGLEAFALGNPRLNQIVGHLTDLREKEEENRLRREDRIARDTQANLDRQAQAEALAGYRSLLEKQVQGGRKELKETVSGDTIAKGERQFTHDETVAASREKVAGINAAGRGGTKPPAGYRATGDGGLEPIPGGPADEKQQKAKDIAAASVANSIASMDRLEQSANELLKHPGLERITGVTGAFLSIPGTNASDAQALLGNLKSKIMFGVLQDIRNNSKTGAGLGSVSDREGKKLEENIAALENAQSYEQMKKSLQAIMKYAQESKAQTASAYERRYGSSGEPSKVERTIVRTGKDKAGRTVIKYSDGTIAHAD